MSIGIGLKNFRDIILLTLIIGFSFIGNLAFASDNVLQAIQIDGNKDSYTIILKSDDTAELKKTIQAPNKMVLNLKGIRASKSINTIYNNTTSVDSVVVEPTGEDSVKILVQANNVQAADIQFDTLKTPLGVLDKSYQTTNKNEESIVLSEPVSSYRPVYEDNTIEEEARFSLSALAHSRKVKLIKRALKNEKVSWMITFGMVSIILLAGIKLVKGKDSEIRVGLSQGLKEREMDLYRRGALNNNMSLNAQKPQTPANAIAGANYGLKAYQNGVKSPYMTTEIPRQRPTASPVKPEPLHQQKSINPSVMQKTITRPTVNTAQSAKTRTTNIDSMKFLESMTKIYEKNGRTDLAQGLKTSMKKATVGR